MPLNDKIANLMLFKAGSLCHRKRRGKKQLALDISIKCRGCHFHEDEAGHGDTKNRGKGWEISDGRGFEGTCLRENPRRRESLGSTYAKLEA